MPEPSQKTQAEIDPVVEPNDEVHEGAWVNDLTRPGGPWIVTKIVNGYARIEQDPKTVVRAVRLGNLMVIK